MARGRFLPLIILVVCGALVLLGRLAMVQIGQHEVWAEEAAGLVRKGRIVPYVRGEIRDRNGLPIVVDRELYEVEFNYREFRRGHPLGLVAHARSALEMRSVSLQEALADFLPWARALVDLTPADLEAFARGEGVQTALVTLRPAEKSDVRRGRARDLAFYVAELVGLDRRDRVALRRLSSERRAELSYLDFAAERRGLAPVELLDELERDWTEGTDFLAELARLRERGAEGGGRYADDLLPALARLVDALEERRRDVEDQSAGDLFAAAAGFAAGRIDPALLARTLDLDWLSGSLRWDGPRTTEWLLAARRQWLEGLDENVIPRLVLEVEIAWRESGDASCVLEQLARLYMSPDELERVGLEDGPTWRTFEELAVFSELASLFAVPPPRGLRGPGVVLPLQDPELRSLPVDGGDGNAGFELLARVETYGTTPDAAEIATRAAEWRRLLDGGGGRRRTELSARLRGLIEAFDARFAQALDERCARLREHAVERNGSERLPLARARLDRAEERTDYALIDRGSRPVLVVREPSYDVVHLLTRWPERFRGFGVRQTHRRVQLAMDDAGLPLAAGLIGDVRKPKLEELLMQRAQRASFEELRRTGQRDPEQALALEELVGALDSPDEWRGSSGLEGYFDRELSGRNGYSESGGLQERAERGRRFSQQDVAKVDGQSLESTLDLVLQREALHCLEHPALDPDPQYQDGEWAARPTGALVLMTVTGEVLAAASVPVVDRRDADGGLAVRDQARERTLQKPDFQPAGSSFKPFVAVFALDRLNLDPTRTVTCSAANNAGSADAGYKGLGCWLASGHGTVDLAAALKGSCNSYFAWLGESHYTPADFAAMAAEFGFGQPTGVKSFGGGAGRGGLREDYVPQLFKKKFSTRNFLEAGNGLGIVEATPMQVARALAGLATGRLPEVRLARSIGGAVIEPESRPLTVSKASLDRVRRALLTVTNEAGGTAQRALSEEELGFRMAAKTGSADLAGDRRVFPDGRERVPKHAWLAGYFPPEAPKFVLVVFVHRTYFTSSHNAAWIARQYLLQPGVREWLRKEGVIE